MDVDDVVYTRPLVHPAAAAIHQRPWALLSDQCGNSVGVMLAPSLVVSLLTAAL